MKILNPEKVTLPLLTVFQRLIDLLAEPKDIPILAPIIQRELCTVYLWAIKARVCARWRRREARVTRSRRQSIG